MKREIHYFLAAMMFYTRFPCPGWYEHRAEDLNKSRKYFPLIGWIIGGIVIAVYGLSQMVLPVSVSILLSLTAAVVATGAFHEDGLADVCDGLGGGWSKQQILNIMKDSRIGTFGTVGITLLLAVKFTSLYEIQQISTSLFLVAVFNGNTVSRFISSTVIQSHVYVQDPECSKIKPVATSRLGPSEMLFSATFAVAPLFFFYPDWILVLAVVPAYLSRVYLAGYFKKWIGGYTGDCLGAVQQVSETIFYVSVLSLCAYI